MCVLYTLEYKNLRFLSTSQGLPCTIGYIEAKPILKTDNVRGILLGEFPVQYEAFDDQVASGKISEA